VKRHGDLFDRRRTELESLVDRVQTGEEVEIVLPSGGRVRLVSLTDEDKIKLAEPAE
jgi:antitoxin (DNA-binding transcriptional repressor) of toxin-antitoxin stability system